MISSGDGASVVFILPDPSIPAYKPSRTDRAFRSRARDRRRTRSRIGHGWTCHQDSERAPRGYLIPCVHTSSVAIRSLTAAEAAAAAAVAAASAAVAMINNYKNEGIRRKQPGVSFAGKVRTTRGEA